MKTKIQNRVATRAKTKTNKQKKTTITGYEVTCGRRTDCLHWSLGAFAFFHSLQPGDASKKLVPNIHRLIGLVVEASASGAEGPEFKSPLRRDFSGSSHTSDLKIGTPVSTLPGAWRYRVSAGPGRPSVSTLWLGEVESLICNFCLSVAVCKIVCADPCMLLGR